MRFNIRHRPHRSDWRTWFAWRPVRIGNERVWLERVERRDRFYMGTRSGIWIGEYR